jgi:hypothetical protein
MIPTHLDPLWHNIREADELRRMERVEERAAVHVESFQQSAFSIEETKNEIDNGKTSEAEADPSIRSAWSGEIDVGE